MLVAATATGLQPGFNNKLQGSTETVTCIPLTLLTLLSSMLLFLVKPVDIIAFARLQNKSKQ